MGVKGWGINYDELRERNAECERLNESDVVIAGVFGHGSRQELALVLVIDTRVEHVNDVLQSVTTHRHTRIHNSTDTISSLYWSSKRLGVKQKYNAKETD